MKIAAERLLSDRLRLELPHEDGSIDEVELARGAGVRGTYEQGADVIGLRAMTADALEIASASWRVGSGRLAAPATALLRKVSLDAEIARGKLRGGRRRFTGWIAAGDVEAARLELHLAALAVAAELAAQAVAFGPAPSGPGNQASATGLALRGATIESGATRVRADSLEATTASARWGPEGFAIEAGRLEARRVEITAGAVSVGFESLVASRLRVARTEGERLEIAAGHVEIAGLTVEASGARVRIGRAVLAEGGAWSEGAVSLPALDLDEATIAIELERSAAPARAARKPARKEPAPAAPRDLRLLDRLEGRLDVDLVVDAKVPLLGRRVATHRFRIPIQGGTINYHRLERDLSFLEDAILDFAVRGDRLVLEKDLPFVPFDGKTLVYWPLDGEGRELAARELVRLRTLLGWQLPPSKPSKRKEGGGLEISRLDFEGISAEIRLGGPGSLAIAGGAVRLGTQDQAAIGSLRVDGAVRHRGSEVTAPTEVRLEAREVLAGLDRLTAGRLVIDAGEIALAALADAVVTFQGLRPTAARATARRLAVRRARIEL